MENQAKIYTLGHSDRSIEEFLSLLKKYDIRTLVDIRAYPHSTRYPHFSEDFLKETISHNGIDYHWAGRQLGGMRKPARSDSHSALDRDSFRGFAEYMETRAFQNAVARLRELALNSPTAIMCAEKQALNCHRSLISDYLVFRNIEVEHIIDETSTIIHSLNELARTNSSMLVYDRNTSGSLDF